MLPRRFRLGGSFFPPLIFYKIFTHRPVADIGAFGPRNYAAETGPSAHERHNKGPVASVSGRPAPASPAERIATGSTRFKSKGTHSDFVLDPHLRQYIRPNGSVGYRDTTGWCAFCCQHITVLFFCLQLYRRACVNAVNAVHHELRQQKAPGTATTTAPGARLSLCTPFFQRRQPHFEYPIRRLWYRQV